MKKVACFFSAQNEVAKRHPIRQSQKGVTRNAPVSYTHLDVYKRQGLNYQKLGKALMSEDEIAIMDGGRCILQLRGVRPVSYTHLCISGVDTRPFRCYGMRTIKQDRRSAQEKANRLPKE